MTPRFAFPIFLMLVLAPASLLAQGLGSQWREHRFLLEEAQGHPYPARAHHASAVFDGKLWIIGGMQTRIDIDNRLNSRPLRDVWYSPDGVTWIEAPALSSGPLLHHTAVTFNGRLWVIGGSNGMIPLSEVWSTSDGVEWILESESTAFKRREGHATVVHDDRLWLIGGHDGRGHSDVYYTDDGVNWSLATIAAGFRPRAHHTATSFDGRMWVIGGRDEQSRLNDVWHSTDGVTWTAASFTAPYADRSDHAATAFGGHLWVFGGENRGSAGAIVHDDVWRSTDGISWMRAGAAEIVPARLGQTVEVFGGRMWVLGGNGVDSLSHGDRWNSPDGMVWDDAGVRSFTPRFAHGTASFDGKLWVIGGYDGTWRNDVRSSSDGRSWRAATHSAAFSPRSGHTTAVHNGRMWVIGGDSFGTLQSDVWSSSDGEMWEPSTHDAGFGPRFLHATTVFDDRIWVGGGITSEGRHNDVWWSADGGTWMLATGAAPFSRRDSHTLTAFDNKLWVIGGRTGTTTESYLNDVWFSEDGIIWEQALAEAPFTPRATHAAEVFDGRLWITGGATGAHINNISREVWYTDNGTSWTMVADSKYYPPRVEHSLQAHDGRLWTLGGLSSNNPGLGLGDDVWYSGNGEDWVSIFAGSPVIPRSGHTLTNYKDRLWLVAGTRVSSLLNDVWSLEEGEDWRPVTHATSFFPRSSHSAIVFDDKLWIVGGMTPSRRRDIWYTEDGAEWTRAAGDVSRDISHNGIALFRDEVWLLGGSIGTSSSASNATFRSPDMIDWPPPTFNLPEALSNPAVVAMGDELWIYDSRGVWVFAGNEWQERTRDSSHHIAQGMQSDGRPIRIRSDGEVYVFESNGWQWIGHTHFPARTSAASAQTEDKIWLFGGDRPGLGFNDTWVSGRHPRAAAVTTELAFGKHTMGAGPSSVHPAVLSNRYPEAWEPLHIASVSIQNDASGAFMFAAPPDTRWLLPGDTRAFPVVFNPSVAGAATADLVIETNDPSNPEIVITLSGEGVSPDAADSATFDFDDGAQGWVYTSPQPFTDSSGSAADGSLRIHVMGNTNTFGFWESPIFAIGQPAGRFDGIVLRDVGEDAVAKSVFRVRSDLADPSLAPTVRMRANTARFDQANLLVVTSTGDGAYSPGTTPRDYQLYFKPPRPFEWFRLSLDVLNFDPLDAAEATLLLDRVDVSLLPPTAFTDHRIEAVLIDEDFASAGWSLRDAAPMLEPVAGSVSAEGLHLGGMPGFTGAAFGFWITPESAPLAVLQQGRVYTAHFLIESDAPEGGTSQVPTFRARLNTANFQGSALVAAEAVDLSSRIPSFGNPLEYSAYLRVPAELHGQGLLVSFDCLIVPDGATDPGIVLTLKELRIESMREEP